MQLHTGISRQTHTNAKGYYTLPVLPVGRYEMDVQESGFRSYQRRDIVLDTDAALTLDASLEIGGDTQTVSVTDNSLHVETVSTQLGEAISGRQMAAVPLNGRSFTDLLSLQPGVAPSTTIGADTVQDVGATILDPSGTLNPGTISVNGQRETANYFNVNGSDAEEDVNAGTAIIPNLDAICRVSHCDEQLRCRIWGVQRRADQRDYKIRRQRIAWQRIRFSAQYRSRCAQLLFADAGRVPAEPVWRDAGRAGAPGQGVLLYGLSRHDGRHRASTRARSVCRRMRIGRAISPTLWTATATPC
jgi:hypothetical protein